MNAPITFCHKHLYSHPDPECIVCILAARENASPSNPVASILNEAADKVRSGEFGPDGQSKNDDNDNLIEWIENRIFELTLR